MDTHTLHFALALFAALLLIEVESMIRIKRFTCTVHDNTTIQDVKCYTKLVNRSMTLMNASGFLVKPIDNVFLNGDLYKRTVVSYRPFLVNVTESICDFFAYNRGGIYLRSIMKLYLPYSNMNHACPYSGLLYARDMPLDIDNFVLIWPDGEYRLDARFIAQPKLIFAIHIFFEVK